MSTPAVLITGAGRGIGRATAIELASLDYEPLLVSRTGSVLQETAKLAGRGQVFVADVSDADCVQSLIERAVAAAGRLDAIVHCAGLAPMQLIDAMTPNQWQAVIDTNLSSAFYLCHAAWPIFKQQKSGVIVNISSESSRDPFDGFAAYGAAKAGLNLFGRVAAREGLPHGIRVHTIAPGAVETRMLRELLTVEQYPAEQAMSPADVAKIVAACVTGTLRHTSGEVIFLHRTI
jgi:NAD(P)-dependent dehydrogenase (short-subunit alcohol dehydrogenase family)